MKMEIDLPNKRMCVEEKGKQREYSLYSPEAFEVISHLWLKVGWNEKYPYTFTWLGRPIIQLPEDILRIQETIYRIKPDLIIETGVAHGGSLILYASLCKSIGKGRVLGIDIEIRPHNRQAIESHELSEYITLLEGSSIDSNLISEVSEHVKPAETVLVILDSNHSKNHVAKELEAYSKFVSLDSYIVATDGSMEFLSDVPRGMSHWDNDNSAAAAREFATTHPEFKLEQPSWLFNESSLTKNITHWPSAWLKKWK